VTTATRLSRRLDASRWWGFWVFVALSVVHVGAIAASLDAIAAPTKLALMPVVAVAAVWALRGSPSSSTATLLFLALAFSWLGDGAASFFPFLDDELPAMLLCFGVAHIFYIALFAGPARRHPIPAWTVVYALWWGVMVAVLWPHLGALLVPVMIYGAVLAATAALSPRGGRITALGGALFLASDTLLALRLFLPGVSETLTGPWVMATYTAGQGLLTLGLVAIARSAPRAENEGAPR